ncbi:tetratricopeptide repeat protein [Acinetobacter sp. P1(2025)]|uniref:tetratricopeptide repeat protein n=1 Tax=Acinetobacter sp. P1(2025) TaxID=3446120 RepID=UPI003F52FEE9
MKLKKTVKALLFVGATLLSTQFLHADAQFDELFKASENGTGQAQFDAILKAAENGDANAQNNVGRAYAQNIVVDVDYDKAVYWYRKAADQDQAEAQFSLGVAYSQGIGVPYSDDQALFWLKKALNNGYTDAQQFIELIKEQSKERSKK